MPPALQLLLLLVAPFALAGLVWWAGRAIDRKHRRDARREADEYMLRRHGAKRRPDGSWDYPPTTAPMSYFGDDIPWPRERKPMRRAEPKKPELSLVDTAERPWADTYVAVPLVNIFQDGTPCGGNCDSCDKPDAAQP